MPLSPGTLDKLIEQIDSMNVNLVDVMGTLQDVISRIQFTNTQLGSTGALPSAILINMQLETLKTELETQKLLFLSEVNNLEELRRLQRLYSNAWDESQKETIQIIKQLNEIKDE